MGLLSNNVNLYAQVKVFLLDKYEEIFSSISLKPTEFCSIRSTIRDTFSPTGIKFTFVLSVKVNGCVSFLNKYISDS